MLVTLCTAKASYKKQPGLLELTASHLQWTQDKQRVPSVLVSHSAVEALFSSKEGSPQVKLKVALVGDPTGHNFTFTSPAAVAYNEREKFKNELGQIVARNRAADSAPVGPKPPLQSLPPSAASSARPMVSRATSSSAPSGGGTPIIQGSDPATEFRLRKRVLLSNPDLGALHKDLVMSGMITEAEFWDGREHLLLAEASMESQKKGKPGQLVDPRPETVDGGEIKIRITPQLVHDIFDEYPVVARAYSENVPKKLSEEEFWKRYFQSKLFNAHRASIRSSATQHVVKDDPILDKYLEKDDDELEPRRQREEAVELLVDLGATKEDHDQTGNEKDITMQAGRNRGALPLIRKFNEHSERLLNSALGDEPATKRRRTDTGDGSQITYVSQIILDDLDDSEGSADILLEMQDRQRYFEGRSSSNLSSDLMIQDLDISQITDEARGNLQNWDLNLGQLKLDGKAGSAAVLAMTQNVAARQDVRTKKNLLPDHILRQMTTCQTAANEFLRQFWASIYPPTSESQLPASTPAQKAAKATKMIGYLNKTQEKVDALVKAAQVVGVDSTRVSTAMQPVLNAVDHALSFYQNRKPPRT